MPVTRTYSGPYDQVEIPALGLVVKYGEPVEVDTDTAKLLDEQPDNWAKPSTKNTKED